jgi:outer membrane protein assembly factor BamB
MKPSRVAIGITTPIVDSNRLFVSSFYDGSLMLRLNQDAPTVERLWRKVGRDEQHTQALHSIISTPVFEGDYVYGIDSYGQMRCIDAATGERIWESQAAVPKARWSTVHMVRHDEKYFMFNERGELIIARLSPQGYDEISRAKLIEPTRDQLNERGGVCWSHPAFANRHIFARNDQEIVAANLATSE